DFHVTGVQTCALPILGVLGMIVYNEVKPPLPKPAEYVAMEQAPVGGDVYFGRYEIYKEKGNPLGMEGRFGWFKILKVDGDIYHRSEERRVGKGCRSRL